MDSPIPPPKYWCNPKPGFKGNGTVLYLCPLPTICLFIDKKLPAQDLEREARTL